MTSLWEAFNSGKVKEGKCELKSCANNNEQLIYRVRSKTKTFYVCVECLEIIDMVLKMKENEQ